MAKANILVADDEANIRVPCREMLEEEGYQVLLAADGQEVLSVLNGNNIDLILLDIKMPKLNGLEILKRIKAIEKSPEIIIIIAYGTISDAVMTTKLGAYDFIEKPWHPEKFLISIENCLKQRKLVQENIVLRNQIDGSLEIYSNSPKMKELSEQIMRIAPTECWVLILGESGAGKELIARKIHRESRRADKPFIEVNCSAIPNELIESELFGHVKGSFTGAYQNKKGKFEQAHKGTIFLDEVGDMSLTAQAKVLRALENHKVQRVGSTDKIKVDVRVISATNKNLNDEIKLGNFREDLYYRLEVVTLEVPPLRERKEDIPILVEYFLKYFAIKNSKPVKNLTSKALGYLINYHWPGNVRELKNLIENLVVLSSSETVDTWELDTLWRSKAAELPTTNQSQSKSLKEARDEFERRHILDALKRNQGHVSRTAQDLGINRCHLHQKMRLLEIEGRNHS